MERDFDVLVAGELNVDLILNWLQKFPELGKEVLAEQMTLTVGSSSAIFACNLSSLGTKVTFAGKVGRDPWGEFILSGLRARGVDTGNIILSPDHKTGASIALNFGEDRAMVTYPGAMTDFCVDDIGAETLQRSRHLHVSSIFLQPGLMAGISSLFAAAREKGLTTSLDPQWDPSENWDINLGEILKHVDIFLPNAKELCALTGKNDIGPALAALPHTGGFTVVKNGRDGAILWDGRDTIVQQPFLNDNVIDSIGAGDSFNAGFIHKYLQGRTLKECLQFAALSGAINTTRSGGTSAFESPDTIKAIAETSFNHSIEL